MNNILKLSTSWQKISFLSNFSILVGMLLGPTNLLESSKDIMRAISSLSSGLTKINFELYLSEILKCVCENI